MKGCFVLPKVPTSLEPHHQSFSVLFRTLIVGCLASLQRHSRCILQLQPTGQRSCVICSIIKYQNIYLEIAIIYFFFLFLFLNESKSLLKNLRCIILYCSNSNCFETWKARMKEQLEIWKMNEITNTLEMQKIVSTGTTKVWLVGFYGISTFVGYLTPNPLLCK